jgi:hypothetical protein
MLQITPSTSKIRVDKMSRHLNRTVQVDREEIKKDILRLRELQSSLKDNLKRKNAHNGLVYLRKILSCTDEKGQLKLSWAVKDGMMCMEPVGKYKEEEYFIDADRYFIEQDEIRVVLEFEGIKDLMSFAFMNKDLGYPDSEVEEKLTESVLFSVKESKLKNCFEFDREQPYEGRYHIKVEDSDMFDVESNILYDYFREVKYRKPANYGEAIDRSLLKISGLFASNLAESYFDGCRYKLIDIKAGRLEFCCGMDEALILWERSPEALALEMFGRLVEVEVVPMVKQVSAEKGEE